MFMNMRREWPGLYRFMICMLLLGELLGLIIVNIVLIYVIGHVWGWGDQFNHWIEGL